MSHEISGPWRLKKQRYGVPDGKGGYGLLGEICPHCKTTLFPPRDVCIKCSKECKEEFVLSGKGTVYSYSTLYDPPEDFKKNAPYTVAIIQLNEGPRITAQLTDVDNKDIFIGMPVEMSFRILREQGKKGPIDYGTKYRPNLYLEITGWMGLLRTRFRGYELELRPPNN